MLNTNQQGGMALPEVIRMRALKGFRGVIDGAWGIANPGDVVDVPRDLAMTLRYGEKAVMVEPQTKKVRQENYVPPYKRAPKLDAQAAQLAALTEAVASLKVAMEAIVNGKK